MKTKELIEKLQKSGNEDTVFTVSIEDEDDTIGAVDGILDTDDLPNLIHLHLKRNENNTLVEKF